MKRDAGYLSDTDKDHTNKTTPIHSRIPSIIIPAAEETTANGSMIIKTANAPDDKPVEDGD
jgi:hypothetical protein